MSRQQLSLFDLEVVKSDIEPEGFPVEFYPGFLGQSQADKLFEASLQMHWRQNQFQIYGRSMPLPRLEAIYGDDQCVYSYSRGRVVLTPDPWNEPLRKLRNKVERQTGHYFRIVIGNQYRSGSDHIGWHSDDEPTMGTFPAIASISLGATRRFSLRHKVTKTTQTWELPHGSLFVMRPGCQENFVHKIHKTSQQVGTRINWTFRPYQLDYKNL